MPFDLFPLSADFSGVVIKAPDSSLRNLITPTGDYTALPIKGSASQTADLLTIQTNASVSLFAVSASGDGFFAGDLDVDGMGSIALDLNVGGNLDVDGNAVINGTLDVDGTSMTLGLATISASSLTTTRTFTLPDLTGTVMLLSGTQNVTGFKDFDATMLRIKGSAAGMALLQFGSSSFSTTYTFPPTGASATILAAGTTTTTAGLMALSTTTAGILRCFAMSGDGTLNTSGALTLANSGVSAGTYTNATVTVNSKGLVTSASNGSAGAPSNAQYVTMALDGTLSGERVLTAGTGLGLTDGGANGNATLAISSIVLRTDTNQTITGVKTITPSSNATTVFKITNAANSATVFNADSTNSRIGIGTATPDAPLEVENGTETQLLTLDQNDTDAPFIDYQGTSATDLTASITTQTTNEALEGFVRIEINGVQYWMPFYSMTVVPS